MRGELHGGVRHHPVGVGVDQRHTVEGEGFLQPQHFILQGRQDGGHILGGFGAGGVEVKLLHPVVVDADIAAGGVIPADLHPGMVLPPPSLQVDRNLGKDPRPEPADVIRRVMFLPSHGDADVVPVAGYGVGHFRDAGPSGELPEVTAHLETVGVAGLGQQPPGFIGVVFRHIVDPLIQPRAERAGVIDGADGLGKPEVRPGGYRRLVDRQVQGAAHLRIQRRVVGADFGESPFRDVHAALILPPGRFVRLAQVDRATESHCQQSVGLVGLGPHIPGSGVHAADARFLRFHQILSQGPRQVIDRIHLLAGQQGEAGGGFRHHQELHFGELRLVPMFVIRPKLVPAVEHDAVVGFPFAQVDRKRPAAGRILQVRFGAGQQTGGVAVPVQMIAVAAQVPHPGRLAPVGLDEYLGGADDFDIGGQFLRFGAVPKRRIVAGRLHEIAAKAQQVAL